MSFFAAPTMVERLTGNWVADVPVAKTLNDLKRLKEEIMPEVEAM